jgi:hypothetical protein
MKKLWSALSAGAKAMSSGPTGDLFEVAGRPVRCPHCGGVEWFLADPEERT